MTKKDYQAIAKLLFEFQDTNSTVRSLLTREIAYRLANDVFAPDNPRFDRTTFLLACEDGNVTRRPKRARR